MFFCVYMLGSSEARSDGSEETRMHDDDSPPAPSNEAEGLRPWTSRRCVKYHRCVWVGDSAPRPLSAPSRGAVYDVET